MHERYSCARRAAALLLGLGVLFGFAGTSAGGALSVSFGGFVLPDDDSGVEPDVSFEFAWVDGCTSSCSLRIDLIYHDSNAGGGLTANPQVLAGLTWDVTGTATVDRAASSLIAPTLVGPDSAAASADLPDLSIGTVSGEDVTGHWAFRQDLSNAEDPLVPLFLDPVGDWALSSSGDISVGGLRALGMLGTAHLLPGTVSGSEPRPPNGGDFGVVDPSTTSVGRRDQGVFAQGSTTAFLGYDGSLTGIENVSPLFGTNGVTIGVVPEPGTGLLLGLGLLGLAAHGRVARRPRQPRRRRRAE